MTYTFDEDLKRYRDENGELVPEDQIRRWVDVVAGLLALLIITRSNKLVEDYSTDKLTAWSHAMRADLTALHYAVAIIAFGGLSQMTSDKWSQAETVIGTQLNYFSHFILQIVAGAIALDGTFAPRASMYALAGYGTYENLNTERQKARGMTEEKRVLGKSDHCEDCKTEAAKNWQPIGTLRAIGDSQCLTRCRCSKIYRVAPLPEAE